MLPRSVYLAGSFSRREELCKLRYRYQSCGITITSRWLVVVVDEDQRTPQLLRSWALKDLEDLRNSEVLVVYNDPEDPGGGGRHTELGIALERGMLCVIVGELTQVFHYHPRCYVVPDTEAALALLRDYFNRS